MYYIPVDSFKQQFAGWDSTRLRVVKTKGPYGDVVTYRSYPVDFIKCVDKDGKDMVLKNSPSIEIRFTDTDNKRTTFYFDRIFVSENAVSGVRSRFLIMKKTIPLSTVKLIEIQDGGKKYKYVN